MVLSSSQINPFGLSDPKSLDLGKKEKTHSSSYSEFLSQQGSLLQSSDLEGHRVNVRSLRSSEISPLLSSIRERSRSVDEAIERLNQSLDSYEKYYEARLNNLKYAKDRSDEAFDFIYNLSDKGQYRDTTCKPFIPDAPYEFIEWIGDQVDDLYERGKPIKSGLDLTIEIAKLGIIFRAQNQLDKTVEEIEKTGVKFASPEMMKPCHERVTRLRYKLDLWKQQAQESIKNTNLKLSQQATCHFLAYPLAKWFGAKQEAMKKALKNVFEAIKTYQIWKEDKEDLALQRTWTISLQPPVYVNHQNHPLIQARQTDINRFLHSLENCKTTNEVKNRLQVAKINGIEVPKQISKWKESLKEPLFREHLGQEYCRMKGLIKLADSHQLAATLKKRQMAFEAEVKKFEVQLGEVLENSDAIFEETQQTLKTLHISISKEEWETKRLDSTFRKELAQVAAKFEEAQAVMLNKGLTSCLLQKIEMEKRPLQISKVQQAVNITVTLAQIAVSLPYLSRLALHYIKDLAFSNILLEHLVEDLHFPGAGFLYLLNANLEETVGGIIKQAGMAVIGYILLRQKQPFTYSLEAYKIDLQISWINLTFQMQASLFWIKQLILQFRIQTVDGLKSHFAPSEAREKLMSKLEQLVQDQEEKVKAQKVQIEALKEKLKQLSLEDFKLFMQPNNPPLASSQDPLDELTNGLISLVEHKAKIPHELLLVFKKTGVDLEKIDRSEWRKEIRSFFAKDGKEMLASYREANFHLMHEGLVSLSST